ncbi:CLUMA_CG001731, isoform A [Clunio marinus]|uniref:CLUMA_CG001731, isoform A n=1 Tax=Clunio marinus TaxID=568069 RepID=A0A1J1HNZ3_9DIPT|nr:CLUMA_CG001731, isoform A [Clunio marinus]
MKGKLSLRFDKAKVQHLLKIRENTNGSIGLIKHFSDHESSGTLCRKRKTQTEKWSRFHLFA